MANVIIANGDINCSGKITAQANYHGSLTVTNPTQSTVFYALDQDIPNTNDRMLITGVIDDTGTSTNFVTSALRTGASTIQFYIGETAWSDVVTKDSGTLWKPGSTNRNINIAW